MDIQALVLHTRVTSFLHTDSTFQSTHSFSFDVFVVDVVR